MNIAVILCTYNRCQVLAKALESLAASRLPDAVNWRVLVIDNNSSDETREVAEGFARRFPGRFEYLFEPRQGKSHALNLGVQHASANSEILAFTDDDVEVDPEWLRDLTQRLESGQWAGSCGRILPERGFIPPPWLASDGRYSLAPLAMFDPKIEPGEINEPAFGANMAFRSEMFSKHGGFRIDLGPQPGGDIKNEDVEFGARLLAAGEKFWYEPSAVVYHSVPAHRVNRSYFVRWWFGKGRSDVRQNGPQCDRHFSLFGVPVVFVRRLAIWSFRWICGTNPAQRFDSRAKAWWLAGHICESFAHYRKNGRVRSPLAQGTP